MHPHQSHEALMAVEDIRKDLLNDEALSALAKDAVFTDLEEVLETANHSRLLAANNS